MTEKEIEKIADKADFVVSEYAFTERDDGFISILNLNHLECAMVVNKNNEIIDTNMVYVKKNGDTFIQKRGTLSDHELNVIQKFIKQNYEDMYKTLKEFGGGDFFEN